MQRDFQRLEQSPFDLLVIGGGIYGAWTAYDAALRGFKVALIEKKDWASGTSSSSSKLIHGGLRYLEQFHFGLVKKSLEERKRLFQLAQHRVLPLRFLIPVYRDNPAGSFRLKIGLTLYDLLAGKGQPVPPHQGLSTHKVLNRYPFLKQEGLVAGYTYGDCQVDDARFTLEVVHGAHEAGAITANYAQAEKLLTHGDHVVGALVKDLISNQSMEVRASMVVNTSGPWAGELSGDKRQSYYIRLTKGVHLLLPPLPTRDALLIMIKRDKRIFFMIPWYGKTLMGTTDTDFKGDPDTVRVEEEDIDYLLTEANRVFHDKIWDRSSILGSFAGLRALRNQPGRNPSQVTREWSILQSSEGLLVSIGGKFTSARADAAKLVDRVMQSLKISKNVKSPTATKPLPWSPDVSDKDWKSAMVGKNIGLGLDPETAEWSLFRYGTSLKEIQDLLVRDPALAERITPELPFCKAEIIHCASKEMVVHLEDLLRRRIPLLILSPIKKEILVEAADSIAPILGWSQERCKLEVESIVKKWQS